MLRLARLREAAQPVTRVLTPILERLAEQTGETAHASLFPGRDLANVGVVERARANRVHIEPGLSPPLHATASGVAFSAFARPEQTERLLSRRLVPVTSADQTFEAGVHDIAVPLFGPDGFPAGRLPSRCQPRGSAPHMSAVSCLPSPPPHDATQGLGGRVPPGHQISDQEYPRPRDDNFLKANNARLHLRWRGGAHDRYRRASGGRCRGRAVHVKLGSSCVPVKAAITAQLDQLPYYPIFRGTSNDVVIELAEELRDFFAPDGVSRAFCTSSGGDSVETTLPLSRQFPKIRGEAGRVKFLSRKKGQSRHPFRRRLGQRQRQLPHDV